MSAPSPLRWISSGGPLPRCSRHFPALNPTPNGRPSKVICDGVTFSLWTWPPISARVGGSNERKRRGTYGSLEPDRNPALPWGAAQAMVARADAQDQLGAMDAANTLYLEAAQACAKQMDMWEAIADCHGLILTEDPNWEDWCSALRAFERCLEFQTSEQDRMAILRQIERLKEIKSVRRKSQERS
jgi:hypothetical protein